MRKINKEKYTNNPSSEYTLEYDNEDQLEDTRQDESGPIIVVTSLFFIWGFLTVMNSWLIPQLQELLSLSPAQNELFSYAFYAGYFIFGLLYYIIARYQVDPVEVFGYKKTLIIGLLVSAIGCAFFYPAASNLSFALFLAAMFILASGFAIMQIVANPYVALLGAPDTAASRLNTSQAFNSLGTTLAPYLGSVILVNLSDLDTQKAHNSMTSPYLGLAAMLAFLAFLISLAHLPEIKYKQQQAKKLFQHKHVSFSILAIFLYVGGEVAIGTHLDKFIMTQNIEQISEQMVGSYLSLYWGGAMIGRFMGAIFMSNLKLNSKIVLGTVIVVASFFIGIIITSHWDLALLFLAIAVLNFIVYTIVGPKPHKVLGFFALCVLILLSIAVLFGGVIAIWSLIAIGIFNSIMFINIFTLGIAKLGRFTAQASALLVMAISGGAFINYEQELLSQKVGLQNSFILPMFCYLYIMIYAFLFAKPKIVTNK